MDLQEFFRIGMDRHIPAMYEPEETLEILVLGPGVKEYPWPHYEDLGLPDWDANQDEIPYTDDLFDQIWATHFFEHIDNIFFCLSECQRVLRPGGVLNIVVPYGTSHCAVQDLGHRHYFNEDTWKHAFDNPYYDDHSYIEWQWTLHLNMIMGIKGENLALFTQLVKDNYR